MNLFQKLSLGTAVAITTAFSPLLPAQEKGGSVSSQLTKEDSEILLAKLRAYDFQSSLKARNLVDLMLGKNPANPVEFRVNLEVFLQAATKANNQGELDSKSKEVVTAFLNILSQYSKAHYPKNAEFLDLITKFKDTLGNSVARQR